MHKKGFTLVETLVVLGLLAVIFSLSLPGLSVFSSNLYLDASSKTLASSLRHTQGQARTQHKTIKFNLGEINLPSQIKITKASDISFSSSGFPPPGGSGSIYLKNRTGKTKRVIVSSAGRVRIE